MSKSPIQLTLVVPVYNESRRLKNLLILDKKLKKVRVVYKLIVVDDGSTDDTLKKLQKMAKTINMMILSYPTNKGKGHAIRHGMSYVESSLCGFVDVDMSTSLENIQTSLNLLKKYDIVIGSRKLSNSKILVHQPFVREFMGRVFTFLTRKVLNLNISDFTCGCKFFRRSSSKNVFEKQTLSRWAFDAEILFLAKKAKLKMVEVPVVWSNDPNTKVKLSGDVFSSFFELVKIRWNDLVGLY